MKNNFLKVFTITTFLVAIYFRLTKLGYSELQSDEIDVLLFLFNKQNFIDFLLTQKKGPGQFIVAFIVDKFFHGLTYVELFSRIPYAFVGIIFVVLAYFVTKKIYGQGPAVIATVFISLSGLLIGLSRYAQFPPFILALACLCVHLATRDDHNTKRMLIINGVLSGIAFLFHYDALAFIIPIFIMLIIGKKFKSAVAYSLTTGAVATAFYIPFVSHQAFLKTWNFLINNRIQSDVNSSLDITLQILRLYHSKEFLIIVGLGVSLWLFSFRKKLNPLHILILLLAIDSTIYRFFHNEPLSYYTTNTLWNIFFIWYLIKLYKNKTFNSENLIEVWFFFSFISYVIFIKFPLTHVYNFFTPLFILISYEYFKLVKKFPIFATLIILILIISSLSFNFQAFIQTDVEYPFRKKGYVFGKMYRNTSDREPLKGIFGFPYKRGWKEIRNEVQKLAETNKVEAYNTNEKPSIARFYMSYDHPAASFNITDPDIYIRINKPYSMLDAPKIKTNSAIRTNTYRIYLLKPAY